MRFFLPKFLLTSFTYCTMIGKYRLLPLVFSVPLSRSLPSSPTLYAKSRKFKFKFKIYEHLIIGREVWVRSRSDEHVKRNRHAEMCSTTLNSCEGTNTNLKGKIGAHCFHWFIKYKFNKINVILNIKNGLKLFSFQNNCNNIFFKKW